VSLRYAALAALAILGLAVVLAPWFELDTYTPNGWDATWWARGALAAAVAAIVALRIGRDRAAAALAALALACVAVRAIVPPDFGLAFDGLDVPTERSWGLWVALGAAAAGLAAALGLARTREGYR
jgi:hypothetical protein